MAVLARKELEESPLADLHAIASELGIEGYRKLRKAQLVDAILGESGGDGAGEAAEEEPEPEPEPERAERRPPRRRGGRGRRTREPEPEAAAEDEAEPDEEPEPPREPEPEPEEEQRAGVLDILPNGSGFMRADAFAQSRDDVYVSPAQIRRCELRSGDELSGPVRPPRRNERHPSLVRVDKVNGADAEPPAERPRFEDTTPVFATERLAAPEGLEAAPFGKGSRVAVGGPPGSGTTTLLRRIVLSLQSSHPDLDVTVVLAGVRPEEVTEWRRDSSVRVAGGGFEHSIDDQAQAAEMAIERGKRAVESGRDAVVVIDSLDALPPGPARRVFGAARNAEDGGSLTVIAATGLAAEPQRQATTQIVLEKGEAGAQHPQLSPTSGTLRADLLTG
jgi:transcription termination factor Rho